MEDAVYVHPELAGVLAGMQARSANHYADIEVTRANFKALMAPRMSADPRVVISDAVADGVPVQIIRPAVQDAGPLPCVLYIHGGGFAYGELDGPSPMAVSVCTDTGAVVLNVHYRLAPEHRFPAGSEDCYTVLCWIATHAAELGIDSSRIAVAGASAGGCLSAVLCLMARDRGGPGIAYQCLLIPITDDRLDRYPSIDRITDPRVINGPGIARTWSNYLGPDRAGDVPAYAAPARATDLSGLPPAYVLTCGMDPLRDQGLDYARRLMEADVPVEVKDVPGAWHFFEASAPDSEIARQTTAHWLAALRAGLGLGQDRVTA